MQWFICYLVYFKVAIDNLEFCCMDPDMELRYEDLLHQWKNGEDNIKDKLDELVDWMASTGTPAGHSSDEDGEYIETVNENICNWSYDDLKLKIWYKTETRY